jgi:methyl-accepting chemotaxis protein-2 (aspartate sensor receptor)
MNPRNWDVGSKITVFTFGLISVILPCCSPDQHQHLGHAETARQANVANSLGGISNTVEVFNTAMMNEASSFARLFAAQFSGGQFALDAAPPSTSPARRPRPSSMRQSAEPGLRHPRQIHQRNRRGRHHFCRHGDEFVRVTTSLKKENGERAVGTQPTTRTPAIRCCAPVTATSAWQACSASNTSPSTIRSRMARQGHRRAVHRPRYHQEPGHAEGKIKAIRSARLATSTWSTRRRQDTYGNALVHPSMEGKNLLDLKASDGRLFIKEMLDTKNGNINYDWAEREGSPA